MSLPTAIEVAFDHVRRLETLAVLTRLAGQAPDSLEALSGRDLTELGSLIESQVVPALSALRRAAEYCDAHLSVPVGIP